MSDGFSPNFRGSRNSLMKKGTEEGIQARSGAVNLTLCGGCTIRHSWVAGHVGRRVMGDEGVQRGRGPNSLRSHAKEAKLYLKSGEEGVPHVFERW